MRNGSSSHPSISSFTRRVGYPVAIAACAAACHGGGAGDADPPASDPSSRTSTAHHDDHRRNCDWDQWGGGPVHSGESCATVDHFHRIAARLTFDPFVEQEVADNEVQFGDPGLSVHYQVPLLIDDDVYLELKAGTYTSCAAVPTGPCGINAWDSQIWIERAFHWSHGTLVADWTFASDWKPEPGRLTFDEAAFQPTVVGPFIYVPGASGSLHKLDRRTGRELATIRLPGVAEDPHTFVAGGIAADAHGNLYYNALALAADNPRRDARAGWLVKVRPDDTVQMASFSAIAVGAPAATDLCVGVFTFAQTPWPPSPDAVPPSALCGTQRPAIGVTPAIGPDGTVITISTAHLNPNYTFVVAVDADLAPIWTTSLRDQLHDGCGVLSPSDATPADTDGSFLSTHCRVGAKLGVDPRTNLPPAGMANDGGTASPVILPDGGVLYGALTDYNQFRGHLFKLDRHGRHAGTYDFGWDITPAVARHDGTYSIITKDNFYLDGRFNMTQLDPQLHREWTLEATNTQSCHRDASGQLVCVEDPDHATGFEWCINAPAVDPRGVVYTNSEDGWLYKISPRGRVLDRTFLGEPLSAGYTPISIDRRGRLFSMFAGDLFVIGGDDRD